MSASFSSFHRFFSPLIHLLRFYLIFEASHKANKRTTKPNVGQFVTLNSRRAVDRGADYVVCVGVCVCSAFHRLRTHAHKSTHGHTHTHRLAQFVRRVNHVSLWDHGTTTLHLELEIGIEIRNWNQLVGYVFRRSSFVVRFRAEFRIGIEIPLTRVNGQEKKAKNTLRTLRLVGGESFSQVFCQLVRLFKVLIDGAKNNSSNNKTALSTWPNGRGDKFVP